VGADKRLLLGADSLGTRDRWRSSANDSLSIKEVALRVGTSAARTGAMFSLSSSTPRGVYEKVGR
jgi:hypothetical protein